MRDDTSTKEERNKAFEVFTRLLLSEAYHLLGYNNVQLQGGVLPLSSGQSLAQARNQQDRGNKAAHFYKTLVDSYWTI
jgi:hypothetical protein